MGRKSLIDDLRVAKKEKDVENAYRAEFLNKLKKDVKAVITSPYGTDGFLEFLPNVRTLLEFKYSEDIKTKLVQCSILIQVLYYLKKFEDEGKILPSTIFVGDKKECFALRANNIAKYLERDIDWTIAPSEADKHNQALLHAMVGDVDIFPFVYDVDDQFDIRTVIEKIKDLSDNVVRKVKVSEKNIEAIFDYFDRNVLDGRCRLSTNERANLFVQLIINPVDNCLHPRRKNLLMTKAFGNVPIKQSLFVSFFGHFEGDKYSPREKEKFTGFVDRLVEDVTRRKKGEFFTPTLFVDEAHKYLDRILGHNWREEYVVWDCACGTGNLTRDYAFKELYMSTLEASDLGTSTEMEYNDGAFKFRYDFLNHGVDGDEFDDCVMPEELMEAIESGRKILFLINPPYKKATPNKGQDDTGVAKTRVGAWMIREKMGIAASQLSTQFLFRILKIQETNKNVKLALFNKPNFMTSDGFSALRAEFLKRFRFRDGFLFNASYFDDTSDSWGVSFSVWDNKPDDNANGFEHAIVEISNEDFTVKESGRKLLYNCDGLAKANNIFIKGTNTVSLPSMKSALNIDPDKHKRGRKGAIGYINNHANNLMQQRVVYLASSVVSGNGNQPIMPDQFLDVMGVFAARHVVGQTWVNDKDELLAPDKENPAWEQFALDSIVYALFHNNSQQSGLRQIRYNRKKWDIINEFFWLSKKEMMDLADENEYDELYRDAKSGKERYLYKCLDEWYGRLSPDAAAVLDAATVLLRKSTAMRKVVSREHPEYHLDSFDAGYIQLKYVWKEYFKDEFEAFRVLYRTLEERLRKVVYDVGYLR
jgi:hypothetical protein